MLKNDRKEKERKKQYDGNELNVIQFLVELQNFRLNLVRSILSDKKHSFKVFLWRVSSFAIF